MNCDDAFEYMTDSAKQQAGDLQWHLDMCPRCRRMQETLEPALTLLMVDTPEKPRRENAIPPASRLDHILSRESSAGGGSTSARLPATRRMPAVHNGQGFRRVVAVAAASLTILAGVLLMTSPSRSSVSHPAATITNSCLWQQRGETDKSPSPVAVVASCLECHQDAHPAAMGE